MKSFLKTFIFAASIFSLVACHEHDANTKKIGIIIPLEHTAMHEIAGGFSETLQQLYHQPVTIKVMNSEGDPNLLRAIIQEMRDDHYAMIVPVGTSTTQMSLANI